MTDDPSARVAAGPRVTGWDWATLVVLQCAFHCDAYVLGVPAPLYLVCGAMMFRSLWRRGKVADLLRGAVPLSIFVAGLTGVNYLLTLPHVLSGAEFLKSAVQLNAAVVVAYVACAYIRDLLDRGGAGAVGRVAVCTLAVLAIGSMLEVLVLRGVLTQIRAALYEANVLLEDTLARGEHLVGFERPVLLTREPSKLAIHMTINVFLLMGVCRRRSPAPATGLLLCGLIGGCALLIASPVGLVAAALGCLVILATMFSRSDVRALVAPTIAVVAMAGAVIYMMLAGRVDFASRLEAIGRGQDLSANVRFSAVAIARDVIAKSPWSGIGLGQDERLYEYTQNEHLYDPWAKAQSAVGNAPAQLLAMMGLPAVVLIILAHAACLRAGAVRLSWPYAAFFLLLSFSQGAGGTCVYWVPLAVVLASAGRPVRAADANPIAPRPAGPDGDAECGFSS